MTPEQKTWLDSHKPYRPIGQPGGFSRYIKIGILHADGSFELRERGMRPRVTQGCFEVGILETKVPGQGS